MLRFLHEAPLFRIAIPLLLGAVLGIFSFPEDAVLFFALVAVILYVVLLVHKKKWKYPVNHSLFYFWYTIIFIICGAILTSRKSHKLDIQNQVPPKTDQCFAKLLELPKEGKNSLFAQFELLAYISEDSLHRSNGFQFILYTGKDSNLSHLSLGDLVCFKGELKKLTNPINPHQFDYAQYLNRKGIGGQIYIKDSLLILQNIPEGFDVISLFKSLQQKCIKIFSNSHLSDDQLAIVNALVIGNRDELSPDLRNDFADAGVIHILAVSGLHVGIIYFIIQWILKAVFSKRMKKVQFAIILTVIWTYAGITGFSPSVLRASTMFSFVAIGILGERKTNTYNMLAASAIFLIIINPLIIREVGFQLSYLAVIGILFFYKQIFPLLTFRSLILRKTWMLLVVSFSAQLATFPLSIYYFGQFPNLFLVTNLMVIPLATLTLYSGLLYLLISQVPFVREFIFFTLDWSLRLLNQSVTYFADLSYAVTENLRLSILQVLLIYVFIFLLIVFIKSANRYSLRYLMVVSLILSGTFVYNLMHKTHRNELYILEGRTSPIIALLKGQKATFICSEENIQNSEYLISDFIRNESLKDVEWRDENENYTSESMIIKDGRIWFHNYCIEIAGLAEEYKFSDQLKNHFTLLRLFSGKRYKANSLIDSNVDLNIFDRKFNQVRLTRIKSAMEIRENEIWEFEKQGVFYKKL